MQITGKVSEDELEKKLYVQLESANSVSTPDSVNETFESEDEDEEPTKVKDKGNGVFQISRPGAHVTKDGILKIYYFNNTNLFFVFESIKVVINGHTILTNRILPYK